MNLQENGQQEEEEVEGEEGWGRERRKEGRKEERERRGYYVNWRRLTGLFLVLPTAAVGGV